MDAAWVEDARVLPAVVDGDARLLVVLVIGPRELPLLDAAQARVVLDRGLDLREILVRIAVEEVPAARASKSMARVSRK